MKKCPKCGTELMEIVYGMPSYELFKAEERGEVVIGVCEVFEDGPEYHCKKCNLDFSKNLKNTYKPDEELL